MLFPPFPYTEMRVPSLFFRVKATGMYGKAYEPHHNGSHLRLHNSMRWYTLEELDPITEEEYNQHIESLKNAAKAARCHRM